MATSTGSLTAGSRTLSRCTTSPAGGTSAANQTSFSSTTTTSKPTSIARCAALLPPSTSTSLQRAGRGSSIAVPLTVCAQTPDKDGNFRGFEGGAKSFFFKGTNRSEERRVGKEC